jgi:hypothetical protein
VHALVALAVVRFGLTLSLGPEYDSNANRAEVVVNGQSPDSPTGSFLLRTTAQGSMAWRAGINLFRATAELGGKVYFNPEVFDQDVLALRIGAEDRMRATRVVQISVAGDYYDAWQLSVTPYRHRDFRAGGALARLHLVDRLGEVTVGGGYRGFEYKPDPLYDFQAGQATATATTRVRFGREDDHEIDIAASYHLERRIFTGEIETFNHDNCPPGTDESKQCLGVDLMHRARSDWWEDGGIEITYVGPLLVAVGYGAQLNVSNSFGYSLLRNIITVKLAYRFPWNLYATVKAQLYITQYLDPVLLDRSILTQTFVTIEDENRNNLIVDVERPIARTGLAVSARYSLFTNEISPNTQVKFLRQVVYLGLTYRLGAR